jgi:NarL family two-component system response regulator LiaR
MLNEDRTMSRIRVLIVDDHNMVRKGLRTLLEEFDDVEVIAEAADGEMAIDLARAQCPDVVLMDMVMPRMNGVDATVNIRRHCPNTQIVALTSFSDEDNVQAALKAGVVGYLMKNVSGDELASAIRRAHAGQSTLAPEAAQVLIRATTRPPALGHDLTERELEVLALMIEGLNNREIGEQLVISSSTVKNHVSSILAKLGTTSRTQAVALAVEHRIVSD